MVTFLVFFVALPVVLLVVVLLAEAASSSGRRRASPRSAPRKRSLFYRRPDARDLLADGQHGFSPPSAGDYGHPGADFVIKQSFRDD